MNEWRRPLDDSADYWRRYLMSARGMKHGIMVPKDMHAGQVNALLTDHALHECLVVSFQGMLAVSCPDEETAGLVALLI